MLVSTNPGTDTCPIPRLDLGRILWNRVYDGTSGLGNTTGQQTAGLIKNKTVGAPERRAPDQILPKGRGGSG